VGNYLSLQERDEQFRFAGATFSPDGGTFFVKIQSPGLTLAITGNW
jgi:secreted PhoX family phosphatase